jgi:hypothetical protein
VDGNFPEFRDVVNERPDCDVAGRIQAEIQWVRD